MTWRCFPGSRVSKQALPATPRHSIEQIRQIVGVGMVLHLLSDVVEQRAGFGIEVSQRPFESAGLQFFLDSCLSQLALLQILLQDFPQGFNVLHRLRRQFAHKFQDIGLALPVDRHLCQDSAVEYETEPQE